MAVGTVVSDPGLAPWLGAVAAPAPTVPAGTACGLRADPGWRPVCSTVGTGSATLTGLVESREGGENTVWKAEVWARRGSDDVETLTAGDATTPSWAWAALRSADLVGDGQRELVFGFENEGTGEILDIDAVTPDGTSVLGGQVSVYKGTATATTLQLTTYQPVYRPDDPNCCPSGGAERETLELQKGRWTVIGSRSVALPRAGPGFPNDFRRPPGA